MPREDTTAWMQEVEQRRDAVAEESVAAYVQDVLYAA